jgi:ATP-binding cassette subfamily B protein
MSHRGSDETHGSDRLLVRVLRLVGPHRRRAVALAATILVGALLGAGAPLLTKFVFDRALFPPDGRPRLGLLGLLVGALVVLVVASGVVGIVQSYLATRIGQLVVHDLRDELYRHLQRMSLRFFTTTRAGEIQSRITNDIGPLGSVISSASILVVANSVFLLASLAAMTLLSWELALLSALMLPVFAYVSFRVGRIAKRYARAAQETMADMTTLTEETLSVSGAMLTRLFDRRGHAIERYRDQSRRLADLRVRYQMAGRMVTGIAQGMFLLAPALIYLGAGFAIAGGSTRFTPGTLVAFTALQLRMFAPLRDLLSASVQLQGTAPLFDRVFEYLDIEQEIVDSPRARTLVPRRVRGALALRDVSFSYTNPRPDAEAASRRWTIEDVSLEVEPGQLAALVGPSGAGKTTLTYLMSRLYDVDSGAVTLDGTDVREIRLASLAEVIGMVTQETFLFHASVRDNLLYARPEATREQVEAAARLAFMHERIVELDDGYDTVVGERGYRMSGGERQRLAIARVILRDPRVLILDEATSALDTTSERLVQAALRPLMAERTTIAIAHRLSTVMAADVIFVIDQGRAVERGTHTDLVAHGLYARLYREQFREGAVEAHCEDGVVLADGDVAPAEPVRLP